VPAGQVSPGLEARHRVEGDGRLAILAHAGRVQRAGGAASSAVQRIRKQVDGATSAAAANAIAAAVDAARLVEELLLRAVHRWLAAAQQAECPRAAGVAADPTVGRIGGGQDAPTFAAGSGHSAVSAYGARRALVRVSASWGSALAASVEASLHTVQARRAPADRAGVGAGAIRAGRSRRAGETTLAAVVRVILEVGAGGPAAQTLCTSVRRQRAESAAGVWLAGVRHRQTDAVGFAVQEPTGLTRIRAPDVAIAGSPQRLPVAVGSQAARRSALGLRGAAAAAATAVRIIGGGIDA
jgi:hypothetical protein